MGSVQILRYRTNGRKPHLGSVSKALFDYMISKAPQIGNQYEETKTRTHLDRQGQAAEAGAAILLEDPEKSYHAKQRVTENDIFDNRLIFGDNLLALKALEQEFAGKVKCVFIDPPYNTGSAFTHYDDGLEHSIWLSLMRTGWRSSAI